MHIITTSALTPHHKAGIFRLWNNEYPANLAYSAMSGLDSYLSNLAQQCHYLLLDDVGTIHGWAFTFSRTGEKWFAIIVDSSRQRSGYGTALLAQIKLVEENLCGWVVDHNRDTKLNGEPYSSPLPFYLRNGFTVIPGIRLEIDTISAAKIEWHRAG